MKVGVAVIGAGRWGVHFIRNLTQHPLAQLIAVVDRHSHSLATCQQKFALDSDLAQSEVLGERLIFASEWERIRNLDNLDAVVIATPASTHYPLILDALECGYHVLAEKPLTLNPHECLQLTRLAEEKNLQLLVDHTYLFHPAVIKGREVIGSGSLGKLRYGYASRTHLSPVRQDVDALWDLAIHDIAIFNHWLGQSPTQVQARGKVWLQFGLADVVWITLYYPDGFQAEIHLCWLNQDKQRRLCVVGSQGSLIFDEMSQDAPLVLQQGYFLREEDKFIPSGYSHQVIEIEKAEPLMKVCDRFLEDIVTGKSSSLSSGWIGAELVQILTCLSLSLQQEGEIISVPLLS
jgi:predicted dehydrogenase